MLSLNGVVFSFKIYFHFSFCSDFDLEATVVNTDKIVYNCLPRFLLIGKKNFFKIINNYCIAHQQNHAKNNNDQAFI